MGGGKRSDFKYYLDYSIGFLTRGCFRQCEFCVNKNHRQCVKHSNLDEFIDHNRPKLCFLDDNFFACPNWRDIIDEVKATKKRFQFKQGLDERLLTQEKIADMSEWKYDGHFIFAFDDINDYDLIESKLKLIYETIPNWSKILKFYVFCGYDRDNQYDLEFYKQDIINVFKRCMLLGKYGALPYIMRHENYENSPYKGMYINLASWCNQPQFFTKMSFWEYSLASGIPRHLLKEYKGRYDEYLDMGGKKLSSWKYAENFLKECKDIEKYYYIKTSDIYDL